MLHRSSDAISWIREVEAAQNIDDLRTSHATTGKQYPNFETLDAEIATALKTILTTSNFGKKVYLEEQKAHKDDRFLRGRHVAHMIHEHFRLVGSSENSLELSDVVNVTFRGDDV